MCKIFENILSIQNELLLKKIAEIKYNDDNEKLHFINKYNKLNYQRVSIVYEKKLFDYSFKKLIKLKLIN
tara:strand:- start:253 stop:462 length:210 start_codon:yes stop_codon:yes gene_type:complete